jgi:hypothetical protein
MSLPHPVKAEHISRYRDMLHTPGMNPLPLKFHIVDVRELSARETEQISFDTIQRRLEYAKSDLDILIGNVGDYVGFWLNVMVQLRSLESVIPEIAMDGSNPLRTDTVGRRWEEVERQYTHYAFQVTGIYNLSRLHFVC